MKKFEVEWGMYPLNYNPRRLAFIEAETEDDARTLFYDAAKQKLQLATSEFGITKVSESKQVEVKGTVLSLG